MHRKYILLIVLLLPTTVFADLTATEGFAIDMSSAGAGTDFTVAFDPTEITGGTTWDDGGEASVAWTIDLSGTDVVLTFGSALLTVTGGLTSSTTITAGVGFDVTGAADLDIGSGDVLDVTIVEDGGTYIFDNGFTAVGEDLGSATAEWNDLFLNDGGVIQLGNDQDVTLTHVADTGIQMELDDSIMFGDTAVFIESDDDGYLDLDADTGIRLNATVTTSGTIELGHASDTTIARAAAGSVTIEGAYIIESGHTFSGDVTATLDTDGSTATTIADSVTVTGWVLGTSSATQLTSPTLITDLIDTTGAADMDYGSADVTDHTFIADGGTLIIDGSIQFPSADGDPAATGELQYDNTIVGMSGGGLRWFDDDSVRLIVDLETDPSDDDYVVAYDADADGFYMKVDTSGGNTAYDDIGDPDAAGSISFDDTETASYVTATTATDFFHVRGTAAFGDISIFKVTQDTGNATDGTLIEASTADAEDNVDQLLLGNGADDYVTFHIVEAGTFTIDVTSDGTAAVAIPDPITANGGISSLGTIEAATLTEGGVGVPNVDETDWVGSAELADEDWGGVNISGGVAYCQDATVADTTYAACYVGLWEAATGNSLEFKSDGALTYDATTGTLAATVFSGSGASLTSLDGENIQNDTIDADSLDWGAFTDLADGGAVSWGNVGAGELANDTVLFEDLDDDGNYGPFTGAWDFTGGSLEIPNATDPDVDAAGEIAQDTDSANKSGDVSFRAYDGSNQFMIARKLKEIQATVITPNDLADATRDKCMIWSNETGMTFTVVQIKAWSDIDDTDFAVEEYDADGASNNATVDEITCDTGSGPYTDDETAISNATIEAGHTLFLDFDDTDDPGWVKVTIIGWFNSDVD